MQQEHFIYFLRLFFKAIFHLPCPDPSLHPFPPCPQALASPLLLLIQLRSPSVKTHFLLLGWSHALSKSLANQMCKEIQLRRTQLFCFNSKSSVQWKLPTTAEEKSMARPTYADIYKSKHQEGTNIRPWGLGKSSSLSLLLLLHRRSKLLNLVCWCRRDLELDLCPRLDDRLWNDRPWGLGENSLLSLLLPLSTKLWLWPRPMEAPSQSSLLFRSERQKMNIRTGCLRTQNDRRFAVLILILIFYAALQVSDVRQRSVE